MITAQILTPWTGSGASPQDAHRPLVADRYSLAAWTDVTGSALPVSPNLVVIEADLDQAALDQIEADPAFQVLWSE